MWSLLRGFLVGIFKGMFIKYVRIFRAFLTPFYPLHSELGYLLGLWLKPFYDFGAQNFFLANNGLGAFLGPNWKVFHNGTLINHFQGVCVAMESSIISENMEYPGRKGVQFFISQSDNKMS